jgi:uncharacterized lipoprotein YehR (DUF1307 family)
MKTLKKLFSIVVLLVAGVSLNGCASVPPYLTCRVSNNKAIVNQGYAGLGIGQDIPDADIMCAALRTAK